MRNRKSIRLKGYDYSDNGIYFITICTKNRTHFFGEVKEGKVRLSQLGLVAEQCWKDIPCHYNKVTLDEFVIMPNHVHGILIINAERVCAEGNVIKQGTYQNTFGPQSMNVASIVRGFKIGVTKYARREENVSVIWQSRFYDNVIRCETALNRVRNYIKRNPSRWKEDCFCRLNSFFGI